MQRLAIALLAEVVREGIASQETDEAVQLADTILQRGTRETPSILRLKLEGSFSGVSRPLFDVVSFIEL